MATLQLLSKYREIEVLLIRTSIGLIFIGVIAPVLWECQRKLGSFRLSPFGIWISMRIPNFWGFVTAPGWVRDNVDES